MLWIIPFAGLIVLFLVAWRVHRPASPGYRDAPLDDALFGHLSTMAARSEGRGLARLTMLRGTMHTLESAIGYLNTLPEDDLMPCARWLCDNGRFLQEETASVSLALKSAPKLPRSPDGMPRVSLFACELLGHTNADLNRKRFTAAIQAWQSVSPLSVAEITCLPLALRAALLQLVVEMAGQCAQQHHAQQAAVRLNRLIAADERKAMRLFKRHAHDPVFLERLQSDLRASEASPTALWLDGYFDRHGLNADALAQSEHARQSESCLWISNAITSLRTTARIPWHVVLEEVSPVNEALNADPIYPKMDLESRAYYRQQVERIAHNSGRAELSVCAGALTLCQSAAPGTVRAHVGYYLLDEGQSALMSYLHAEGFFRRLRVFLTLHACGLYRLGSWLVFFALMALAAFLGLAIPLWPVFAVVFLFAAQRAAMAVIRRALKPRLVPRMQMEHLTQETQTLVVCPTMLLSGQHALAMVKHLSVLHQANPDSHLHFLLLGDFQDSLTGTLSGDADIISTASAAIQALCDDTEHPFLYMQRERVYHPADHLHMSRERKRGSLETLLKLISGRPVEESFSFATVPPESLCGQYRYVITLDSDTILPPGAALRMVGAMLHPLNRREESDGKMRGVSILQPRMEVAAHTVSSTLSLLLGGQGGTDPYNALMTEFYFDACGRGSFVGKGIIDPTGFLNATENNIIPGSVLSHDLLEGELAGCALTSDITLYDGHPAALKGFLYRLHRWTRGDWQLLPYVLPVFPAKHRAPRGVLSAIGKHKIWQNMLRSLVDPLRVILLGYAVATGRVWLFVCALLLAELPALLPPSAQALAAMLLRLAALPCTAGMQADAIARTLYRLFFSRRNLLQWTTAAQLSKPQAKPPMLFFYLSMAHGGAMAALSLLPGGCVACGIALGAWWAALPFALPFLEQPYEKTKKPTGYMREVLHKLAAETLVFFETAITDEDHSLPPDNVQIDPNKGISHRTSPTNIGLYLTSLIAAERMRLLSPDEMARRMQETVDTLQALPKWEGHLYNWYDTLTLRPLAPAFVSSVDSGNLAVCLFTCAQGIRVLLPELPARYASLAAQLDALAEGMHFSALFDPEAELFYVGYHTEDGSLTAAHYDLLASESRLLSFVAIMLRQVPLRHWYRLGRMWTRTRGGQTILSYSGTMFEYMMPLLFQKPVRGTLLSNICAAALRVQQSYRPGGVFGVSESGYYAFDPNLYYQYRAFGLPRLSLSAKREEGVIAPYASVLSLPVDAKSAFQNVLKLQSLGLEGPLGLFEAVDFSSSRTDGQTMRVVRSHMAHHQGMIMCAICNALEEDYIATLFSSLPRAQAYRLLLEEKSGRARGLIRRPIKRANPEAATPPLYAARTAEPLHFPIDAHLLHGAGTSVMVDAQGNGFISRNGVMMTRFHESCHLPSGIRFYLRDSQSGAYWSATDPVLNRAVSFETAQAVFSHERFQVECALRVFVNPLDGAALHLITLQNQSGMERMMEVCSYLEPTLAPQRDDAAHPAFQNLFIRTERLDRYGVTAIRRPRRENESERRLWHMLSTDASLTVFHVQTDRTAFLGRGRTVYAPRTLELPISATADGLGDMVEPCLSLRGQFILPPNGRLQFLFATLMPGAQDSASAFYERYLQPDSALKCYEPALTRGLMTARYLGLDPEAQNVVSRLVGSLCYTGQPHQFRHAGENNQPLSGLWGLGISGDLPILLVECPETGDTALVKLLLRAHAFLRMNGVWMDLVAAICPPVGYGHPLVEQLSAMVRTCHSHELFGKEGGVHLFDSLPDNQLCLLRAAARLVLNTAAGSLEDQLRALDMSLRMKPAYTCRPSQAWKSTLAPMNDLLFDNGYGGFTRTEGDYVISLPPGRSTPAPWCNPLCSQTFGTLAGESGLVFTYAKNSHSGRLTRWPNDSVTPRGEENFFLQDDEHKLLWSLTRLPLGHGMPVRVIHAPGETDYEASCYGIASRMQCFTDLEAPIGVRVIHLKNEDRTERTLTLLHTCVFSPGEKPSDWQLTSLSRHNGSVYMHNPMLEGAACLTGLDPEASLTTTMSIGAFEGLWGSAPTSLSSAGPLPSDAGNVAVLCFSLTLKPGESRSITTALAFGETREDLQRAIGSFRRDGASLRLHAVRQHWEERLGVLSFDLPEPALSLMLGRWLPYQVRAARLWMRAGFYQAGGAIGFRDQLQDMLCLVHTEPQAVRAHLLVCAAHQFEEGDVQHWWHPPRYGVRTRISDDLLFLPFVTAVYVHATGDSSVLNESVPYLHGEPLGENEQDRLFSPEVSALEEPLWQHCLRAIDHVETGAHSLPLMGGGDWNDGMNAVGGQNGESVWLGMFLCEVLRRFAPLCEPATARGLAERRVAMLNALDRAAWDGGWYLRGWYDDGSRLGSASSAECRLDVLPQSWGVLCGVSRDRCTAAMDAVWRMLYERDIGILKLFTPPFDGVETPGYIAGYLPGVRENGGQYTHAVPWAIAAFHQIGMHDRAWELVSAALPINHAATRQLALRYRVEPYVLAADIYANPQQRGRGGWTWYTGSASWLQYVLLEQLFGFQKTGSTLRFRPVVPAGWDGMRITYRYGSATYHLRAARDCPFPTADGEQLRDGRLTLVDDGRIHEAVFPLR